MAQLMLGVVLTDDEQWEEGLIALRRAIELEPDNAEIYNSMGFAYSGLDQIPAARSGPFDGRSDPFTSGC